MLCPACLTFSTEREANVTVAGTVYCSQHGKEALVLASLPERERRSAARPVPFTPPEG